MDYSETKTIIAIGRHIRMVRVGGWEWVERVNASGIAVIVAVTDDRKIVLVEQFRKPHGKRIIELPAGLAGDIAGQEQEDLEIAARRELLEETGYEAREMRYLTEGPTSSGLCSEAVTLFYADGLKRVHPGGGDASEDIEVHEVPLAEADAWLAAQARAGKMIDPKVYAGLHFAAASHPKPKI